ncbi:MAG: two-component system response regulator [Bacteroidia bacterium]|jgi:two-component system response regulator
MENTDYHNIELLIVEDNHADAKLINRALIQLKLPANKFFWVKDGEEALNFIFAKEQYSDRSVDDKPKIILLDLKLPKIDGIDVLKQIRADERTCLVPVVIMTSSREEKDVIATYESGANSYIVKSVDFSKFMSSTRDLVLYWLFTNHPPE